MIACIVVFFAAFVAHGLYITLTSDVGPQSCELGIESTVVVNRGGIALRSGRVTYHGAMAIDIMASMMEVDSKSLLPEPEDARFSTKGYSFVQMSSDCRLYIKTGSPPIARSGNGDWIGENALRAAIILYFQEESQNEKQSGR